MSDKQPDALRLADMNEATNDEAAASVRLLLRAKSAAELRRQHAAIAELVDALQNLLACWRSVCIAHGWDPQHVVEATNAEAAIAKHGAAS